MSFIKLINGKTCLADKVEKAHSFWPRLKGLMGRTSLPEGHALWIRPCNSIHTFFMKFPIDVIFASKENKVVAVIENMQPWRVSKLYPAVQAFEFPAGTINRTGTRPGDYLYWSDV